MGGTFWPTPEARHLQRNGTDQNETGIRAGNFNTVPEVRGEMKELTHVDLFSGIGIKALTFQCQYAIVI